MEESSCRNSFEQGALVARQHHNDLGSGYGLQPSGGANESPGSTFWRDMLSFKSPVEVKLDSSISQAQNTLTSSQIQSNGFIQYPAEFGGSAPAMSVSLQNGTLVYSAVTREASSPPPPPRVYKPCAVCGDKASGYHYGVCSCEGCKGFFRRSVQKSMEYTCHKEKQCIVNKMTRNRCQFCRLQKCYEKGMSKEAVRNDRHKKRKMKEQENSCSSSQQVVEELTKEEEQLIDRVLLAHEETFPLVENDDKYLLSEKDLEDGSGLLWERVSELSTDGIIQIVKFSKRVAGFSTLSTSDQITLLKAACLEILILRLSSRYNDEKIECSNGLGLSKQQLENGAFGSLTTTIFKFAQKMQQIEANKTEYAMLCAVCLMSGDRSGLEGAEDVERLQEPLLEALKHYVRQRRPTHPHTFARMLMKLSDLRGLSVKGAEEILKLGSESSVDLPPLIVEMLDRAENVCIPPRKVDPIKL